MDVDSLLVIGVGAAGSRGGAHARKERSTQSAMDPGLGRLGSSSMRWPSVSPQASPISGRSSERVRSECLHEMPTMIDILTLGLSAGLSFDASLEPTVARVTACSPDASTR